MSAVRHIRATPFHARTAAGNLLNRWATRNGFTLAEDFGDAQEEALAARANVALLDISWRSRVCFEGADAGECVSRLMTRDATRLQPSQSLKALWLNDDGSLRGAGIVARFAADQFLIVSAAEDNAWFMQAAQQFRVSCCDVTEEQGGVALIGPFAKAVLQAAGLDANLEFLSFRKLFWRGLDVTLSRWGEHEGFEIWCDADDCLILWDRLLRAGAPFAIRPAGVAASDILDVEAGIPRPHRDYRPIFDETLPGLSPASLGLTSLIDETAHRIFNGSAAWRAARDKTDDVLVGVEIDSETPASFVPLMHSGAVAGHTLSSVHSPTLRRAIALARVDKHLAAMGTEFSLVLPMSLDRDTTKPVAARIADLPFVKPAAVA
jgi:aminomethyltransferase